MTSQNLTDRVALVTGAASGIGRAVARQLSRAEATVFGVDRREMPESGLERDRRIMADITKPDDVEAMADAVRQHADRLDILVSCAGVGNHERLDEGDPDKWERVIETNLTATMRVARALLPLMEMDERGLAEEDRPPGDVVIVSSVAGQKPYEWGGAYGASKAGLDSLAETLRLEAMPQARVTAVAPGIVESGFFDNAVGPGSPPPDELGWHALSPEDIADVVLYAMTRPPQVALNRITVRPTDQDF